MGSILDALGSIAGSLGNAGGNGASWGGLLGAGYFDNDDVKQQKKYVAYLSRPGVSEKMDILSAEEGSSLLVEALVAVGADKTPETSLGKVYPIIKKRADEYQRNSSLPVAHETCPPKCGMDRVGCEKCLKRRLTVLEALYYVECPDEYYKKLNVSSAAKPVALKCSLCGAPVTAAMTKCDYCDTPVVGAGAQGSRVTARMNASPEQTAYDLIYEMQLETAEKLSNPDYRAATKALTLAAYSNIAFMTVKQKEDLIENSIVTSERIVKIKMTIADLHEMASIYHISVGTYLRSLFDGDQNVKTAAVYRNEQKLAREKQQRDEASAQRSREAQEQYARKKKANDEYWQRYQAARHAPQYCGGGGGGGGSGYCCGTCSFFNTNNARCAVHGYETDANGHCGHFKLK